MFDRSIETFVKTEALVGTQGLKADLSELLRPVIAEFVEELRALDPFTPQDAAALASEFIDDVKEAVSQTTHNQTINPVVEDMEPVSAPLAFETSGQNTSSHLPVVENADNQAGEESFDSLDGGTQLLTSQQITGPQSSEDLQIKQTESFSEQPSAPVTQQSFDAANIETSNANALFDALKARTQEFVQQAKDASSSDTAFEDFSVAVTEFVHDIGEIILTALQDSPLFSQANQQSAADAPAVIEAFQTGQESTSDFQSETTSNFGPSDSSLLSTLVPDPDPSGETV